MTPATTTRRRKLGQHIRVGDSLWFAADSHRITRLERYDTSRLRDAYPAGARMAFVADDDGPFMVIANDAYYPVAA
jgi:hypothetical protein